MKQILSVARMGHPILRERAKEIDPARIPTPEFQDLIDSMLLTMEEYEGVGLAAPQVHLGERLVVFAEGAGLEDADGEPLLALINPQIEALTDETRAMWEGCLSVPGLRGRVSRPARIRVRGLDRRGRPVDLELEDFDAVVTQHECDHLDGVLFLDRLDDTRLLAFEKEFEKHWLANAEDDGDYVGD
ncbi:MAG TPA: peptide deformylase [Pseudomonadales bacterium]|nr:peptide deformylase [Pseudomonadales bacterium]